MSKPDNIAEEFTEAMIESADFTQDLLDLDNIIKQKLPEDLKTALEDIEEQLTNCATRMVKPPEELSARLVALINDPRYAIAMDEALDTVEEDVDRARVHPQKSCKILTPEQKAAADRRINGNMKRMYLSLKPSDKKMQNDICAALPGPLGKELKAIQTLQEKFGRMGGYTLSLKQTGNRLRAITQDPRYLAARKKVLNRSYKGPRLI